MGWLVIPWSFGGGSATLKAKSIYIYISKGEPYNYFIINFFWALRDGQTIPKAQFIGFAIGSARITRKGHGMASVGSLFYYYFLKF